MKGKLVHPHRRAPHPGVKCGKKSLTVPDETYTIRELFLRYARGTMPPIGRNMFDGAEDAGLDDVDQEELMRMDIVDQRQVIEEVRDRANDALKRQKADEKRKREREKAERVSPGSEPQGEGRKEPEKS